MVLFWSMATHSSMNPDELKLWESVRDAQQHMADWRLKTGTNSPPDEDPWNTGLIGVEWSSTATTQGDLAAKRSSTHPSWAVQFYRWFNQLNLNPGDRIAIFSSGSFPGMLLNALAAAESLNLDIMLVVSLGSSSWGANHPDAPWPVLADELRKRGFIRKKADFYTLGGGNETGGGLSAEGKAILIKAATDANVTLLDAQDLDKMIIRKSELIRSYKPSVFINIGGSHANLGSDEEVLKLSPGLVPSSEGQNVGNGVLGFAMNQNIPVIHILNLKLLSHKHGLPYDARPRKTGSSGSDLIWCVIGVLGFLVVLWRNKRWQLQPLEDNENIL